MATVIKIEFPRRGPGVDTGTSDVIDPRERSPRARKRHRQTLRRRATERGGRQLLDALRQAVILLDSRGLILECNRAASQAIRRGREEALGRNFLSLLHADSREPAHTLFQTLLRNAEPCLHGAPIEVRVASEGRSSFGVHVEASSISLGRDRVLALVLYEDGFCSERDGRTGPDLDATQQFSALTFIKNDRGIFQHASPAFASNIGVPLDAIVGSRNSLWLPSALARQMDQVDQQVLLTRETLPYQLTMAGESGMRAFQGLKMPYLGRSGRPIGVFCVSTRVRDELRPDPTPDTK